MAQLQEYIDILKKMNRAVVQGYKAPHKPVLLLSIMDLIEKGLIADNHITLSKELNNKFKELWKVLVDGEDISEVFRVCEGLELRMEKKYPYKCNICNPFYYMQHEPFWSLKKSDSWKKRTSYSMKNLKEEFLYAELDKDLFLLMCLPATKETIRRTILELI